MGIQTGLIKSRRWKSFGVLIFESCAKKPSFEEFVPLGPRKNSFKGFVPILTTPTPLLKVTGFNSFVWLAIRLVFVYVIYSGGVFTNLNELKPCFYGVPFSKNNLTLED